MGIFEYIISSVRCLKTSKMRTFLTALGIIVGINSVILINILGSSLGSTMQNIFGSLSGGTSATVRINYNSDSIESTMDSIGMITIDGFMKLKKRFLEPEIISDLEEHFDNRIRRVEESNTGYGGKVISDSSKNIMVSLTGVSSAVLDTKRIDMTRGRFIIDSDIVKKASVGVIQGSAAKELFGIENPVGKTVGFTDFEGEYHELVVVGVYNPEQQEQFMLDNSENSTYNIYVPYTYHDSDIKNKRNMEATFIIDDLDDKSVFSDEAYDFLIPYFQDTDMKLEVKTSDQKSKEITKVVDIITGIISAIAAISLFVGGIGVMNIMLVSVTERTMEIGVRKAMGANNNSIRLQFLTESVMISLLGSVIGILSGIVQAKILAIIAITVAQMVSFKLSVDLTVPVNAVIFAVLFSFAIGIIFGVYPANKAAKMQVVDALRYE